jgi:hypothetical protein
VDAQSDKAAPPSANEVTPALRRLREQNELLRTKLFQLQRALIASGTLPGHAEVGHPLAEVVPEERRLRGSSRITSAFGGMNQSLSMPPVEFLRSLIERGTDVIFYKDFNQCWYQRGLLGVSEDVPSTLAHIRCVLDERPSGPVQCVGTSAGGFAAILFGVLLDAGHIAAFAPQTGVTERVFRRFRSADSRLAEVPAGGRYLDLVPVLEKARFSGRIDIHYARDNPIDQAAAERLAHFPFVTLHPAETDGHNVASHLRRTGHLAACLEFPRVPEADDGKEGPGVRSLPPPTRPARPSSPASAAG